MQDLLVLAAGAAIAGFVQGISGFAFSMVALTAMAAIEARNDVAKVRRVCCS